MITAVRDCMVCKFQMEKLVDQRNVYVSDDCRFCCYCLLWSTGFNPLGEFMTSSKTLIPFDQHSKSECWKVVIEKPRIWGFWFKCVCLHVVSKHMAQWSCWTGVLLLVIFIVFKTNQNQSWNRTSENNSFCQGYTVRNEELRNEIRMGKQALYHFFLLYSVFSVLDTCKRHVKENSYQSIRLLFFVLLHYRSSVFKSSVTMKLFPSDTRSIKNTTCPGLGH